MIDRIAAGKNNSRKIGNIYLLLPELACSNAFEPDKRMKNKIYIVFS